MMVKVIKLLMKNCPWILTTETFEAVPHPDLKPMAYSKGGFGF